MGPAAMLCEQILKFACASAQSTLSNLCSLLSLLMYIAYTNILDSEQTALNLKSFLFAHVESFTRLLSMIKCIDVSSLKCDGKHFSICLFSINV